MHLKLITFLFCVLYFCCPVNAIKCYQCNSIKDAECQDIATQPKSAVEHFLKECDGDYNGATPFCRKIDLTVIYGLKRRVVRTCGWVKSKDACYDASNDDHLESVCQCFTEACNDAINKSLKIQLIIFGLGLLSLTFGRYFY